MKTAKPRIFTLKNQNGMTLRVSDLGGTVTELTAPDRNGKFANVVLAYDEIGDFFNNGHANSIIGRVANRISKAAFMLDGECCKLAANNGANSLHGGKVGFDRKIWNARQFASADGPALELTYLSPDGEEGYPGNLFVRVVYTLTEYNAWRLEYWAMTDAPTVFNPTNHAYFNLSGGKRDVLDHELTIFADRFTPTDAALIPTGEVLPVEGTVADLRAPVRLGDVIGKNKKTPHLNCGGFDNNYLTRPHHPRAAFLHDPESGRSLECLTSEPCIQLYTANNLKDGTKGRKGAVYGQFHGVCLETQHAPDAVNQPGFKPIRLDPGKVFHSKTEYVFSAK